MSKTLKIVSPKGSSRISIEEEPLGKGGEGSVYKVLSIDDDSLSIDPSKVVAKIYHNPEEGNRQSKIVSMIKNPPETTAVAWPLALVALENDKFQGYLMDKLPFETTRMWAQVSHSQQRKQLAGKFDVRYALTASLNLALALSSIHEAGHRVGDINESNIFIGNDARVLIVDTDSAQILKDNGEVYPCMVGKPEYTAAELTHGKLKDHKRTAESDTFGYAVAVYQLLTGGAHPADGVFTGEGEPPSTVERIRNNLYPNLKKTKDLGPVARTPSKAIPSRLQKVIIQALDSNPSKRATLEDFEEVLDDILDNLVECKKVKNHWYDKRDRKCGWCEHAKEGNPDPWNLKSSSSKKKRSQKTLPAVKFEEEKKGATRAPRASAAVQKARRQSMSGATPSRQSPMNSTRQSSSPRNSGFQGVKLSDVYQGSRINMPKSKGKTLLEYQDGSIRPRPPISVVYAVDKRKAFECFVNELPDFLQLAPKVKDKVPNLRGYAIGLLVGLLLALSWFKYTPILFNMIISQNFPSKELVVSYFTQASVLTACCGVILKYIMAKREVKKIVRTVGDTSMFSQENIFSSILDSILTAFFFGPVFIITIIFLILMGVFKFGSALGKANR